MKIKLLILGGIIPLFINSQITITNNDMPNVNDIYVYSIGNTNFSQRGRLQPSYYWHIFIRTSPDYRQVLGKGQ